MNDPDNFLSRWSRRKREAGEGKEKKEEAASEARAEPAPQSEPGSVTATAGQAPVPKFDAESLPPVESISAETDITGFLRADVPETLKRAALRRAWSSDPAIRDFVGLNENYWDAAGPDGIPGFGDLDPNLDVKRLVSELFGETPRQDTPSKSEAQRVEDSSASPIKAENSFASPIPNVADTAATSASSENILQRNEDAAAQTESAESAPEKKLARRHGGAMPQ